MKHLALIPARAGSERLPGKNKAPLGGKPLISWTIDAAQMAAVFDKIVVTTDDKEILVIAAGRGCEVVIRPPELAQSDTEMLPVVKHALSAFDCDTVMLLQPTSPFRTAEDILKAFKLLNGSDSVVSVTEPKEFDMFDIGHALRLRPTKRVVVPNGAIYLVTREHLMTGGNWYTGVNIAYEMPKERSIDIDTKADLEYARFLVEEDRMSNDRLRLANESG